MKAIQEPDETPVTGLPSIEVGKRASSCSSCAKLGCGVLRVKVGTPAQSALGTPPIGATVGIAPTVGIGARVCAPGGTVPPGGAVAGVPPPHAARTAISTAPIAGNLRLPMAGSSRRIV